MSLSTIRSVSPTSEVEILQAFLQIRQDSENICAPLEIEDYGIQTIDDTSPPKWHLAHTSWFFETFILKPFLKNYKEFHPLFAHLFNSYYELAGTYHPRPERGLLSRPTVKEVYAYRSHINHAMQELLADLQHDDRSNIEMLTNIGMHHEQQHQELILTDIKHIFACNPLKPVYRELIVPAGNTAINMGWHEQAGGVYEVGANFNDQFVYDNETPRHKQYIKAYSIASCLITNGEYLSFMEDGGYQRPEFWLSDGWKTVRSQNWQSPLYWEKHDNQWYIMSLSGLRKLDDYAPVSHVSFYEADAYARWSEKRLPFEGEWEVVANNIAIEGNFRDQDYLQPIAATTTGLTQFYGDVWEWTRSSYAAYPGYKATPGALGEYNGKFMNSQMVLRGGSCFTPANHIRTSYRNFFYPKDRWQMSGIRLAEDIE